MLADSLLIVFVSFCTAFLSEGILYVLVYRTDHYTRLKTEIEKRSKKCERYTHTHTATQCHSRSVSDCECLLLSCLGSGEAERSAKSATRTQEEDG